MFLKVIGFRVFRFGLTAILHRHVKPKPSAHISSIVSKSCNYKATGRNISFYVDRYGVQHFKPPWYLRWSKNHKKMAIFGVLGSLAVGAYIYRNMETIPYSNRKHLVLLPMWFEKLIGEEVFEILKEEDLHGKILPPEHPKSVRVKLISDKIINTLHRRYDVPRYVKGDEVKDFTRARRKGMTSFQRYLEGMDWEVVVVDEPVINAFAVPGGKIVVYTKLIKLYNSDDELAEIIGHEIGHIVARHSAEKITNSLWFLIQRRILNRFVNLYPKLLKVLWKFSVEFPISRRRELEADYIGMLLMASAGYDPRAAPMAFKKMGHAYGDRIKDLLSTHPSSTKRVELLAEDKVMNEALSFYREAQKEKAHVDESYLLRCFKTFIDRFKL